MAIVTNLQVQLQKGKGVQLVEIMKEVLPLTLTRDGCHRYDLCIHRWNEDKVGLFGKWESMRSSTRTWNGGAERGSLTDWSLTCGRTCGTHSGNRISAETSLKLPRGPELTLYFKNLDPNRHTKVVKTAVF